MCIRDSKEGNADILYDRRPTDPPFYQVGATFVSPSDEHYYGMGQNHEGYLDRRGHAVRCAHDYNAPAGPSVCVPFVVTNKGYGLMWDNPGKTTAQFGFNEVTKWTSDVGQRVSFFVIEGKTYDEIYEGYKLLTGDVPMPVSYTHLDVYKRQEQGDARTESALGGGEFGTTDGAVHVLYAYII